MKVSEFIYHLPPELIAQEPLPERSASRLLHLDRRSGRVADRMFADLPGLLEAGDLLVFNDSRVIPARLPARKASGGGVEILIERLVDEDTALVQLRARRKPATGSVLVVADAVRLGVGGREGEFWVLERLDGPRWTELLETHGHVPLPPYIRRPDEAVDRERYQTVFARVPGAVAAPTAGLHFDDAVFRALGDAGIRKAFCTLHVGAGTFQPVRVDDVETHRMHPEWLEVSPGLVAEVERTQAAGKRVVAVGTTAVRALETAAAGGRLQPFAGDSRLFIYPGFEFRVIDALVTNFHLPGSTLLMLVSAFAGREKILVAYRHAVEQRYRFFSYGDAMVIL